MKNLAFCLNANKGCNNVLPKIGQPEDNLLYTFYSFFRILSKIAPKFFFKQSKLRTQMLTNCTYKDQWHLFKKKKKSIEKYFEIGRVGSFL